MKSKFTLLLFCLQTFFVFSQSVGIGTANIDPSAKLQVEDTQRGFLPPRLTIAQRNGIINPAVGLTIYNLTTNCLEFFNGSIWVNNCQGQGSILYDMVMNAAWLDTVATFGHTYTYDATNDLLQFDPQTVTFGRLLQVPLIPNGILQNNQNYIVEVEICRSRLLNRSDGLFDNDMEWGISDGINVVGIYTADSVNVGGSIGLLGATSGASFSNPTSPKFSSTFNPKNIRFVVKIIGNTSAWGCITNTDHTGYSPIAGFYTQTINASNGLFFEVYGEGATERHTIDYIKVQIRKEVQ